MNDLEKILDKYFRDERILYYHPGDSIAQDHFIRWNYHQHERGRILISIGSNDGEVEIKSFTDPIHLEWFINLVIY